MQNQMLVRIADIVFAISSNRSTEAPRLEDAYQDFLCIGAKPEVIIRACYAGVPQVTLRDEDRVFDSEAVWRLYRISGKNVFVLKSPISGRLPYRVAIFDADFGQGEVHSRSPNFEAPDAFLPNPLEFPLSEVLMTCLLAQGRGLMVHACGIDDGGRGYLFAGNSTHGKTTMARLWRNGALILNDDRIVLRRREGCFWMYGTPWHGDYTGVSPNGVPLERIFFLRHADANSTRRKAGVAASSMLLTRSFPPLWDSEGIRFTLDFSARLVQTVPCYELGFVPDGSVVDFVRGLRE